MSDKLYIAIIDNGGFAQCLCELLEASDDIEKLVIYTSAEEAYAHLLEDIPDVLIMDVDMPKLESLAFCDVIRKTPQLVDMPIVLISGDSKLGDFTLYFKGVDLISKPVDMNKLLSKMRLYTGLHKIKEKLEDLLR